MREEGTIDRFCFITRAICGSTSLGFGSVFIDVAKLQLLHHPVRLCQSERYKYANLTRAYFLPRFLRFPDRLIKLFEVKCSFLDKLTHSQTYRGFIYAHNAYNCTRRSRWTTRAIPKFNPNTSNVLLTNNQPYKLSYTLKQR